MEKRWVIKEQGAPDKVREMAKELNVSEIIANSPTIQQLLVHMTRVLMIVEELLDLMFLFRS